MLKDNEVENSFGMTFSEASKDYDVLDLPELTLQQMKNENKPKTKEIKYEWDNPIKPSHSRHGG